MGRVAAFGDVAVVAGTVGLGDATGGGTGSSANGTAHIATDDCAADRSVWAIAGDKQARGDGERSGGNQFNGIVSLLLAGAEPTTSNVIPQAPNKKAWRDSRCAPRPK